jgi:hypothetical protein
MAVPQIGALAPIASATTGQVSGLGQFGESLANLPDAIQHKQLERATEQDQLSQLDDKRLQQIATMAMSNPAYAQHPELIKGVTDIYKRRGLPPPITTDENGTRLDMNALSPGKQFGQMTEAEKAPYRALEPQQRAAEMQAGRIQGAPAEFLRADASVPLSPGEGVQLLKTLADGVTVLSDPTKDPILYAPILKSAQVPLGKLGIHVMDMLTPQIDAALQTRSQNAVAREVALGITAPAEAVKRTEALIAYDKGRLANAVNETKVKQAGIDERAVRTQGQLQRWDVQNKGTLGNLAVAQQRVQAYAASQSPSGAAGLLKYGKFLQGQLGQAQSGYDSLANIAKGYVAAFQPVPPDIQGRMDTLKEQIDSLTPLAGQAVASAAESQKNMIRAATGAAGVTPSGYGGSAQHYARGVVVPDKDAHGATFTGRMQNGLYETTAKDARGNNRYWRDPQASL